MTTVLFAHGLESGPHGRKVRLLTEAGFTVVADRMPCGTPAVLQDPVVLVAAAATAAAVIAVARLGGALWLSLAVIVAVVTAPIARAALARRVLRRSVAVQRRALARHRVDVVVGSSFGGAVALELVRSGAWTGPTVLLCPAHCLVAHRARQVPPSLRALPPEQAAHVVVVHGRADAIVPIAHSQELVAGTAARLVVVDDDHRLTATATADNLAGWIALARD